ncbi:MAG TPA: tripartite tricarboxylate transporter substrate binding protein, partial [Reyranella sp.]|nr:tripartite tricarboxylate transporter substrate binding protein [Reyranella sp.]
MLASRFAVLLAGFAAMGLLASTHALAQTADTTTWPNRPVRMVVPFPAGGPTDILARVVAQRLSEVWGQAVVIENQPGANTAIAAARVAKMPADGYTLLAVMDVTMVLNPVTNKTLSYDPLKDFAPITLASKNTSLLSVRADDGPASVKELIARAKASPGKLNYGAGIITTRLAGYLFNREAGLDVQYIPFQGSPPTVQGLLTGAVDYIVDGAATSLPLIQSGKLRALAKLNSRPLPALPDVRPLAVEAGIPALDDISTWIGFVAPAGTPRAIVDKIQREVVTMYADPVIAEKLEKAGIITATSTPEEFDTFVRKELYRWG